MLADMPIERIKEVTRDRLRIKPLTDAGIRTIQAILDSEDDLEYLPGIGETTASGILGAAQTLRQTTYDEMPVRIDIKNRTIETTELLRKPQRVGCHAEDRRYDLRPALAEALTPLARALDKNVSQIARPCRHPVPRRVPRSSGDGHAARPPDCWE